MNDSVFTFAELAVLAGGSPHWAELRDLLSIPGANDGVIAAGVSSLLMRELARTEPAGGLVVRDDVRTRVDLLWAPARVISLTRGDATGMNVAIVLVPDSGSRTIVLSLVHPGVFDITPLLPATDSVVQLRDFVLALVADGKTALALGPKNAPAEILLGHEGGTWSMGRVSDELSKHPHTTDQAAVAGALEKWLRAWLAR